MRILITTSTDAGEQVLIMPAASEADWESLEAARRNLHAEDILTVPCQVTPDGPVRDRLLRAGRIRDVQRG